jgi:hypothetical protein
MEFINISLKEIEKILTEKKIPYNSPGFYDHPNFLKEESKNAKFLEIYAAYVYKRQYSDEYLQYAESTIIKISNIFSDALQRNNCLGACIDTTNTVARILDRYGIWNFGIKGCVTLMFPIESKLKDTSFWQFDVGNYEAPHAWLFCPPFNVLDLTIKHQSYRSKEVNYLPEYIANQTKVIGIPKLSDIASPLAEAAFGKVRIKVMFNEILRFQKVIRTLEFKVNNTKFRYIPIAMGLSLEPLEEFRNIKLDGLYPYDFYLKNIKNEVIL